ncbi:MAG: zinc ABC transporter substrate-binding protein, partial [Eubacteriales bacterium]|nr:zinc ABC transporter substrate-binding protein [Eubacteriales bacterium]
SAETEASFKTIAFLAKKVDELNLPAVLAIEGGNHAIAETVVASTQAKNQVILSMNSLQSMTEADVQRGESYLSVMTQNLAILTHALN